MSDKASTESQDRYRDTVFLPRTTFPMRGSLPVREPETLARWKEAGLDAKIAESGRDRQTFTLHDGPPYANGHLHIGHALNKINKDVINRAQRMSGFRVRYVPGWDCHGLPIEWRVEEEYRKSGRNKDETPILEFRAECREYARKWVDIQSAEFQRLGVQGEWQNRYATMDFASEASIVEEIGRFLLNGELYRGLRPVMWSPVEKTALAEAEIEYHDITSTTIYVAFPIVADPTPAQALTGVSAVIWTTTPWTIPANRALAYGPDITYVVLRADEVSPDSLVPQRARLLVAEERVADFCAATGIVSHHVLYTLPGDALEGAICAHPLRGYGYEFDVPMLPGDFVTTDTGTGLVHMAPAHGQDDFLLTRQYGIEVPELVQDDGTYAPWVPHFAGLHVFKAADPVCEALAEAMQRWISNGDVAAGLLARGTINHSYPHSWRSRKPIIFRATPQWFIRMDGKGELRAKALDTLKDVTFVPEIARNRLTSMVEQRPDWCISRQRAWGVPIAVFVQKGTGEVLRDPAVMTRIVEAMREHGADIWYSADPAVFLGPDRDPADYEQVFDIVDVWFESGSSHTFVLGDDGLNFPADLYLEGSDQHRGWFQSSLLESVGTRGIAPFRALVTNGFVLDEQGRKMSKSLGNVIAPADVTDKLGADILRLWVVNSDTNEDLRIGNEILKQQGELYRRLRNTLRWLLGALDGFTPDEALGYDDLPELEKYILYRVSELGGMIDRGVQTHQWVGIYPALHGFCTTDLSAFYFDVRKDAIYCDARDSHRRRAARTVLDILHRALCTWLAPVLVFTAEEAWTARFGHEESVHLQPFLQPEAIWNDVELGDRWTRLRAVRRVVTTELETARRGGVIGSSLEAKLVLPVSEREAGVLGTVDWAELAIVSQADIEILPNAPSLYLDEEMSEELPGTPEAHGGPRVLEAPGEKCLRCWRVLPEVGTHDAHSGLCLRCVAVVEAQGSGASA
ncbi:isoleucyl-tRNA synthetase [Neoasaia chiangmaiensis NBRC 101099]|uniref:Isoleucine--tRNA ligase n=1 Tax=Neoasaia chiangmaiensis TaxID=320497 RepID=A0A1U9KLU9_9PROT|nr:isoleucine--tRNA ligase [Neoasaia chiangmaiensis]AQS86771.1 isoleucine--tRNA ligase [Neoasaia chiangmaiensis]GBR35513.1 isoleucyl-tRNA synthetase [Neoasaia chiangmaiensis NBRC 101099]GEN16374.1 isoleucine--tRNA ligase [Neoasaia chiangmaiensis]